MLRHRDENALKCFDSFNYFTYYARRFKCSSVSIRRIINVPNAQSIINRHRYYLKKQLNRHLNLFPAKDSRFDEGNSLLACRRRLTFSILTCTNANNQTETNKQKNRRQQQQAEVIILPRSNTTDTVRPTHTLREI